MKETFEKPPEAALQSPFSVFESLCLSEISGMSVWLLRLWNRFNNPVKNIIVQNANLLGLVLEKQVWFFTL